MALFNTTVPIYYGRFRDEVLAGRIPVCREVAMEMNQLVSLAYDLAEQQLREGSASVMVITHLLKLRTTEEHFPWWFKELRAFAPQNSSLCWAGCLSRDGLLRPESARSSLNHHVTLRFYTKSS